MTEESIEARLGRLRGDRLPTGGIGAREIEQAARNGGCDRIHALLVLGVSPTVAEIDIYGGLAPAQSTFAVQKGSRFEDALCRNGGDRLLALYRGAGRLPRAEVSVVDISQLIPRAASRRPTLPPAGATREQRRAAARQRATTVLGRRADLTLRYLRRRLSGDQDAPTMIVQGCLPLTILGRTYHIIPDLLVADADARCYRVGEIKLYPDRGGRTALEDVRGASRQAAVGVVALRRVLLREGQTAAAVATLVPPQCDLILRAVDTMRAMLRLRPIAAEVADIERLITRAPGRAAAILSALAAAGIGASATIATPAVLDAIPARYDVVRCGLCALRDRCLDAARDAGDPVTLGGAVRDELAALGTLPEILSMVDGARVARDAVEEARVRRLHDAQEAWQRAVAERGLARAATPPGRRGGAAR